MGSGRAIDCGTRVPVRLLPRGNPGANGVHHQTPVAVGNENVLGPNLIRTLATPHRGVWASPVRDPIGWGVNHPETGDQPRAEQFAGPLCPTR